jgi:hypothetical protein
MGRDDSPLRGVTMLYPFSLMVRFVDALDKNHRAPDSEVAAGLCASRMTLDDDM